MKHFTDVTSEYLNDAKKGIGEITYSKEYRIIGHSEEVEIALWLHNNFGGNIRLIVENNDSFGVKNADYEWNGKLWELKTLKSEKSIDSALRKAISQIYSNPGGVILNFGKNQIKISQVLLIVKSRIETSCRFKMDVMIMSLGKLEQVIRCI